MSIASDILAKLEEKNAQLGKKLKTATKYAKAIESIIDEEAPAIRDRIKTRMEELEGKKPAAKKPEAKKSGSTKTN